MASTDSFVFNGVKCHEISAVTSSPIAEGILSLNINKFYSNEEKNQVSTDRLSAIFDYCICEFEFCSEIQHDQNKIKLNKNFVFTINDKSEPNRGSVHTTQFNGLIMNLDRVIKIEGTKTQKYFYSGIKIGSYKTDGLRLFETFVPRIFLFNYTNKKDMQVVHIPSEFALREFITSLKSRLENPAGHYNDILLCYEMTPQDILNDAKSKLWNIGFGLKLTDFLSKYET